MEDASIRALELGGPRSSHDRKKIARLEAAAKIIAQLMGAANTLKD